MLLCFSLELQREGRGGGGEGGGGGAELRGFSRRTVLQDLALGSFSKRRRW